MKAVILDSGAVTSLALRHQRTVASLLLSLIDGAVTSAPPGLEYHSDFLVPSEENRLLTLVDDSELLTDIARRVLHFGYKYDYTSRGLDDTARSGPQLTASATNEALSDC